MGQTTIPAGLSNDVVGIAASGLHSLALKADGTVTAWGWNEVGQTDVAGLSNVVVLAGGLEHNLALKSDGTVVGWGSNKAWANSDCQYLGHPGCVREPSGQIDIPRGLSNVVAIAAGNFHSLALMADGTWSPSLHLSNPRRVGKTFECSANTQSGKIYVLQYSDSLVTPNWTSFSLVPGTGAERVFIDSTAGAAKRFYRLRRW